MSTLVEIPEPRLSRLLFADSRFSWIWLIIRVYVGWQWLSAGWGKVVNPAWVGAEAGTAVKGFLTGALAKTAGAHPSVSGWYGWFVENVAMPNSAVVSYLVAYGEVLIGIALILGIFTGVAAFFGAFMNLNFLFAGTVSINPLLGFLQLFLILGWRNAGWIGLDRWVLPKLGTPWAKGTIFKSSQ